MKYWNLNFAFLHANKSLFHSVWTLSDQFRVVLSVSECVQKHNMAPPAAGWKMSAFAIYRSRNPAQRAL